MLYFLFNMPKNFWKIVRDVIEDSDVLLLIMDSRMVEESRNHEIETKVAASHKPLIYVINKADLVDKKSLEKWQRILKPCVFVSATMHLGGSYLREAIMKKAPSTGQFNVGVLGYPNTGKSSIINMLKGKGSAKTSSKSGYTTGVQKVRINKRMSVLDTPGVFPYREKDEAKHMLMSARTFGDVKDPEATCIKFLETYSDQAEEFYGVKHDKDPEVVLERIAVKLKKMKKGGEPDINSTARMIIRAWQTGKIKR